MQVHKLKFLLTDARSLGIKALVRESGDIDGTSRMQTCWSCWWWKSLCGVIAAKRHIHMTPADAQEFGWKISKL